MTTETSVGRKECEQIWNTEGRRGSPCRLITQFECGASRTGLVEAPHCTTFSEPCGLPLKAHVQDDLDRRIGWTQGDSYMCSLTR